MQVLLMQVEFVLFEKVLIQMAIILLALWGQPVLKNTQQKAAFFLEWTTRLHCMPLKIL